MTIIYVGSVFVIIRMLIIIIAGIDVPNLCHKHFKCTVSLDLQNNSTR